MTAPESSTAPPACPPFASRHIVERMLMLNADGIPWDQPAKMAEGPFNGDSWGVLGQLREMLSLEINPAFLDYPASVVLAEAMLEASKKHGIRWDFPKIMLKDLRHTRDIAPNDSKRASALTELAGRIRDLLEDSEATRMKLENDRIQELERIIAARQATYESEVERLKREQAELDDERLKAVEALQIVEADLQALKDQIVEEKRKVQLEGPVPSERERLQHLERVESSMETILHDLDLAAASQVIPRFLKLERRVAKWKQRAKDAESRLSVDRQVIGSDDGDEKRRLLELVAEAQEKVSSLTLSLDTSRRQIVQLNEMVKARDGLVVS